MFHITNLKDRLNETFQHFFWQKNEFSRHFHDALRSRDFHQSFGSGSVQGPYDAAKVKVKIPGNAMQ